MQVGELAVDLERMSFYYEHKQGKVAVFEDASLQVRRG
jgi:hypothetical protein